MTTNERTNGGLNWRPASEVPESECDALVVWDRHFPSGWLAVTRACWLVDEYDSESTGWWSDGDMLVAVRCWLPVSELLATVPDAAAARAVLP